MNQLYQQIHKQAMDLHYKFRDIVDSSQSPLGENLRSETKQILEDIESDRPPRHIDDAAKNIQRQLEKLKHENSEAVLSFEDIDFLWHSYERMRVDLHKLPNY